MHLFDAELRYRPGVAPLAKEGEGTFIGSGDGEITGPKLTDTLRWTRLERPGEFVCGMSPVLRISLLSRPGRRVGANRVLLRPSVAGRYSGMFRHSRLLGLLLHGC